MTDNPADQEVWPGRPYPLGATFDGSGTNFSLFSEVAEGVELCLFDADGHETRVPMTEVKNFNHHVYLPGLEPGQEYGYRVHGPWAPSKGLRFNPHKLLLDPYGKAVDGGSGAGGSTEAAATSADSPLDGSAVSASDQEASAGDAAPTEASVGSSSSTPTASAEPCKHAESHGHSWFFG